MKLTIVHYINKIETRVKVTKNHTIKQIKDLYEDQNEIDANDQKLIWKGMELNNDTLVHEIPDLDNDSKLICVLKLRGGMFHVSSGFPQIENTIKSLLNLFKRNHITIPSDFVSKSVSMITRHYQDPSIDMLLKFLLRDICEIQDTVLIDNDQKSILKGEVEIILNNLFDKRVHG